MTDQILLWGAIAGALTAVIGLTAIIRAKVIKPLADFFTMMHEVVSQIRGTPEEYDLAGKIIREAQPSLAASVRELGAKQADMQAVVNETAKSLAVVKQEVKNSHVTNLREDLDEIRDEVRETSSKLDTHIKIAATESQMIRELHAHHAPKPKEG